MSDNTNASADPGGNGAPAPAAAPDASAAPAAAPAAGKWYESMGFDPDTVGWMENRGLTGMDVNEATKNAINGFRNAEKFLGVPKDQLLRIPNFDKADSAEINQFWEKLGRPTDPKGYEIQVPEGQPTEYADYMSKVMHEAGVPKRMAEQLVKANAEFGAKIQEQTKLQREAASVEQAEKLKAEWGQAYDDQIGVAKFAAAEAGVNPEQIDALQDVLGYDGVMKLFANIGEKFSEPKFHSGDPAGNANGPMTPTKAQARIKELQGDKEWAAKYIAGNTEARNEMDRLMRMAYPS